MADPTPGMTQQIAGDIFSEMVLQEAIKDKTSMMEQQLKNANGGAGIEANYDEEQDAKEFEEGSDLDDEMDDLMNDDETEKIMRTFKEARME